MTCEHVKSIYQHAPMTTNDMDNGANRDREVVILDHESFQDWYGTIEAKNDCLQNNYILAFDYCTEEETKIRRHFVPYEALKGNSANGCAGADLIRIAKKTYNTIPSGGSVQQALDALDACACGGGGTPTGGPSKLSNSGQLKGLAVHQTNLGDKESLVDNSEHATIAGGQKNKILEVSDHSFIGAGDNNYVWSSYSSSIVGGDDNRILESTFASILGGQHGQINRHYGVILGGQYALVENYGEVAIGSEVPEVESENEDAHNADAQKSTFILNAITSDDTTEKEMFLSEIGAERIKFPLKGKKGSKRDAGSLNGVIKLSGLYVTDDSGAKASTLTSEYLFAAVADDNGGHIVNLQAVNSISAKTSSHDLTIGEFTLAPTGDELKFSIKSGVKGEVLWTASIEANRMVKNLPA